MTIATDPKVIPLGTKVLILFHNESHKRYDGVYTARDTGGAIKGNIIDLYMGDFNNPYKEDPQTVNFGRVKATVYKIQEGSI